MTGYVRMSANDIITGADIKAAPLDTEFNKLRDAFSNDAAKSHTHDGSIGNSTKIALTTSVSGYLPAVHGGTGGKNNFAGTTIPTTTDDTSQGYEIGSVWYNTSTGRLYVCTTSTASNAIWKEFSLGTSGGSTTLQNLTISGTTNLNGATNIGDANSDVITVVGTTTFQNNTTFGTANTDTMSIVATPTFTPQIVANGGLAGAVSGDVTGNVTGNISSSGSSSLNNVTLGGAITGGTIENSAIGGITPNTITGTVVTASTNFVGDIAGNVTGNVTASTGTSVFTNVDVNGTLNMNAGTTATITNLTAPINNLDAATKKYVDDTKASILGSVTTEFDTLQEIEALIGDDQLVSGDLVTMIGTKLSKANGGTMSANIVMSNSAEITGLPNPPTANSHATSKAYVDGILGSATIASDSATAAQAAQGLAESARDASIVAKDASELAYTNFSNVWHGPNATDPTGLSASDYGDVTFNTATNNLKYYTSGGWQAIGVANSTSGRFSYLANANGLQTNFTGPDEASNTLSFTAPYIDVYKNGVKQSLQNNDYSLSGGNTVVFPSALSANDVVEMVTWNAFEVASLASYLPLAGGTINGDLTFTGANANIQWDKSDDALEILDNAKITLGTSGTHELSSTGIASDSLALNSITSSHNYLTGTQAGAVSIFHNNKAHIVTETDGINVRSSTFDATARIRLGHFTTNHAGILQDATWVKVVDKDNNVVFRGSTSGGNLTYQDASRVLGHINGVNLEGIVSLQSATVQHGTFSSLNERRYDLINDLSGNALAWDIRKATVFDLQLTSTSITSMTLSGGHGGGANEATGFTLRVVQPASGSLPSITWDSNIKWVAGTPPTLTSTNGAIDVITFVSMQGHYYGFVTGLNVS